MTGWKEDSNYFHIFRYISCELIMLKALLHWSSFKYTFYVLKFSGGSLMGQFREYDLSKFWFLDNTKTSKQNYSNISVMNDSRAWTRFQAASVCFFLRQLQKIYFNQFLDLENRNLPESWINESSKAPDSKSVFWVTHFW